MWLWRREWHSTPVFLPGESQAQRSLAVYSPQGHKDLDTTEWLIHTNHANWGLFSQWFPTFLAGFVGESFSTDQGQATVLGRFKCSYIYYALYFYYYYISSTSDLQVLEPRGWEPLVDRAQAWLYLIHTTCKHQVTKLERDTAQNKLSSLES